MLRWGFRDDVLDQKELKKIYGARATSVFFDGISVPSTGHDTQ